ncbi:trichohyalin [Pieris rapae]|uniref:trichohyalin n=1 Tax=Pieris rapae TaxID=64459 RepID=UPI001E27E447|nr:trichohyalin [Pieris rapae]
MPSPGSRGASCYSTHRTTHPDSPRRSRCPSPKKISPISLSHVQSSASDLIGSIDYEISGLDSIPARDIKLLQALARKKEENDERDKLAEHFQKMWLKEKEEREAMEVQTSEQYRRYLHQKRIQDKRWYEFRSMQQAAVQQAKREQLMYYIQHKAQKSAEFRSRKEDREIMKVIDRSMEEEARLCLAAERRLRLNAADNLRKRAELYYAERKEDDARLKRRAMLRDTAKRVAINNALTSWETALQRHELASEDAARRATYATLYARKRARGFRVTRAMDKRRARARRIAAVTELMRDAIRNT